MSGIFAECGFTGCGIVSSEIEWDEGEVRVGEWIVGEFVSVYVRVRVCGVEVIVDSREGMKVKFGKSGFRLVVGVVSK